MYKVYSYQSGSLTLLHGRHPHKLTSRYVNIPKQHKTYDIAEQYVNVMLKIYPQQQFIIVHCETDQIIQILTAGV